MMLHSTAKTVKLLRYIMHRISNHIILYNATQTLNNVLLISGTRCDTSNTLIPIIWR